MFAEKTIESDVLVIGGGMAGLFAAIKAAEEGVRVTLVDKNYVSRSGSTAFAEGCFSVFHPEWGHDLGAWMTAVNQRGEYLTNQEWLQISLEESYDRYRDLESWGIRFQRAQDGTVRRYHPSRPGIKDVAGIENCFINRGWKFLPLMRQHAEKAGVRIVDRVMVTDLLTRDGAVTGAAGFHTREGDFHVFKAGATVMTTGNGAYKNVPGAMGPIGFSSYDGEVMAYRAGADISGKEFCVQGGQVATYPRNEQTRISVKDQKIVTTPAEYPAWVAYGPHISYIDRYVDADGYPLSGRASGVTAIHEGRGPLLWNPGAAGPQEMGNALRDIADSGTEFRLARVGLDITAGGLWLGVMRWESNIGNNIHGGGAGITSYGTDGETGLPGLYGAGDTYRSGCIGAVYPSYGFAMRNASVTGARAGRGAAKYALTVEHGDPDEGELAASRERIYAPLMRSGGFAPNWVEMQLENIMFPYYVFYVRHAERMQAALTLVEFLKNHVGPKLKANDLHELRLVHETNNRILSTEMMLRSALFRTESRGFQYREDFPGREDPYWLALVKVRDKGGRMELEREPLPRQWWPDLSLPYAQRYPLRFPGEL